MTVQNFQPQLALFHYVYVGGTQMWCVLPDCDGIHHYYRACEH